MVILKEMCKTETYRGKKISQLKRQESYLRKSLLFSTVFIPMFSKERARRGLIEYQLKVTGEAMRITMYKIFFFFFHFYNFFFSKKCSEWKCTLSKSLVTACIFQ